MRGSGQFLLADFALLELLDVRRSGQCPARASRVVALRSRARADKLDLLLLLQDLLLRLDRLLGLRGTICSRAAPPTTDHGSARPTLSRACGTA